LLALLTVGRWSDAKTTWAPWVAKAAPVGTPVAVSPEALDQRMHPRALAVRQDMIRTA
jgi:hypothetical protein